MLSQRLTLTAFAAAALLAPRPAAAQYEMERPSPMSVGRPYYESSGPGYSVYYPAAAFAGSYRFYPGYYTGDYRPSRFASSEGYYATRAPGYSPIFFTSLNYPGIYGSYTTGLAGASVNVAPTVQTRPLSEVPLKSSANVVALTTRTNPPRPALIDVSLPAEATLTFQGVRTTPTGAVRTFESPPLVPGRDYTYDVRATWTGEDGNRVVQTRHLTVRAGDHLEIDLSGGLMPRAEEPENERPTLRTGPLPRTRNAKPATRE